MGANESKKGMVNDSKRTMLKKFWRPRSFFENTFTSRPVTYQSQSTSTSAPRERLRQIDSTLSRPLHASNGFVNEPRNMPNFTWLEGRRFMDTAYMLPSDDRETDRNVLQHFMLKKAFGNRSIYPPVRDILMTGGRVLDVGCGAGTWCLDVAHEFPCANVIGIDIISCFPESIHPSNCEFLLMDVFKTPTPLEVDSFDVINMQLMSMAVSFSQWSDLLIELKRILKPGGWIQWIEPDCEAWGSGAVVNDNTDKFRHIMTLRNLDPYIPRKFGPLLQRAGYDNIRRQFISLPLGEWGGPLGKVMATNCVEIMASTGPLYRTLYGWTAEILDRRVELMLADMRENRGYLNYHLAIARKPFQGF